MENNIDKIFKDQLRDREFEFREDWWKEAEKLLDADKRRRRFIFTLWTGIGVVTLLTALVGAWWFLNLKTPVEATRNFRNNAPRVSSPDLKKKVYPGNPAEQNAPASMLPDTPPEQPDSRENPPGKKQTTQDIFDKKSLENQRFEFNKTKPGHPDGVKNPSEVPDAGETHPAKTQTGPSAGLPVAGAENPDAAGQATFHDPSAGDIIRRLPTLAELEQLPYPDSRVDGDFSRQFAVVADKNAKHTLRSPFSIGVCAAQLVYIGKEDDTKPRIGFRAGALVLRRLGNGWHAGAGLHYLRRSGSFDVSKIAESRTYRFSVAVESSALRPTSLHYAGLPVMAGWRHGRHVLEGALGINYLLGMQGEFGNYNWSGEPPARVFVAEKKGWIAEDGYKKLTAEASLGYRYHPGRQLSFGVFANHTFGGMLKPGYEPPLGSFLLKEDGRFYLSFQASYFIK